MTQFNLRYRHCPLTVCLKNFESFDGNEDEVTKIDWNNSPDSKFNLYPKEICILNFNYTETESYYYPDSLFTKAPNTEIIHIHGNLSNQESVIFGYGDELDENYKKIENLTDNEYLKNIKSINYLEHSNYKKLLNFVSRDKYQIFILGHSCGISDRTLLNKLFEDPNCASIKVFYHKKEDGTDNYSEIISNISRNFNDKTKMRDRVVNKEYCSSLIEYKSN